MVAGGKYDFTAKWWNPAAYQAVVDHFRDRVQFVQCGEQGHWHPPLTGVANLIGRTNAREFIRLMYWADGVICPVTFAMHLAAAVEMPPDRQPRRPCVVIAGGREPTQWEAYPHHQYLSTVGMLSCCADGGCWKSRCQKVGDGDPKDAREICEQPVSISEGLVIPRCLDMITADDVIRRIEMYLAGDAAASRSNVQSPEIHTRPQRTGVSRRPSKPLPREFVLRIEGGVDQLLPAAIIRNHVQRYHSDWKLAIAPAAGQSEFAELLGLPVAGDETNNPLKATTTWLLNGAAPSPHASPHWPNLPVSDWLLRNLKLSPIEDLFRCEFRAPTETRERVQQRLDEALGGAVERFVLFDGVDRSASAGWHDFVADLKTSSRTGFLHGTATAPQLPHLRVHQHDREVEVPLHSLAEMLALIDIADLLVASESPTVSLASGTRTHTVVVWRTQHPVRSVPPVPHLQHLLTAYAGRSRCQRPKPPTSRRSIAAARSRKGTRHSPKWCATISCKLRHEQRPPRFRQPRSKCLRLTPHRDGRRQHPPLLPQHPCTRCGFITAWGTPPTFATDPALHQTRPSDRCGMHAR